MTRAAVYLDTHQRFVVDAAIRVVCSYRGWRIHALNVRTTHVHIVVTAAKDPHDVLVALKANATRAMRVDGCWSGDASPWSRGGSKRWLFAPINVERAVKYTLEGQDGPPPEF